MKTEDVWEFIFKKQLEDAKPLDEEMISKLEGSPVYGEYKEGEKILYFMDQEEGTREITDSGASLKSIDITVKAFAYPSGFDNFILRYRFDRLALTIPVCVSRF